jgi:protein phosphatase
VTDTRVAEPTTDHPRLFWQVATDVGGRRAHNEDAYGTGPGVVVVADGLGGHSAGEVAATIAVDTIVAGFVASDRRAASVAGLFADASAAIRHAADDDHGRRGMATCAVAVFETADAGLVVGNVGDCRAYAVVDGTLARLTRDDNVVDELLFAGELTEADAWGHPHRNVVTAALGIPVEPFVTRPVRGERRDALGTLFAVPAAATRLLLCSDGLSDYVEPAVIDALVCGDADDATVVGQLVTAALAAGGPDNVTVAVTSIPA